VEGFWSDLLDVDRMQGSGSGVQGFRKRTGQKEGTTECCQHLGRRDAQE